MHVVRPPTRHPQPLQRAELSPSSHNRKGHKTTSVHPSPCEEHTNAQVRRAPALLFHTCGAVSEGVRVSMVVDVEPFFFFQEEIYSCGTEEADDETESWERKGSNQSHTHTRLAHTPACHRRFVHLLPTDTPALTHSPSSCQAIRTLDLEASAR